MKLSTIVDKNFLYLSFIHNYRINRFFKKRYSHSVVRKKEIDHKYPQGYQQLGIKKQSLRSVLTINLLKIQFFQTVLPLPDG